MAMLNIDELKHVNSVLSEIIGEVFDDKDVVLQQSRDIEKGDIALPCFVFAKKLNEDVQDITARIAEALNTGSMFEKVCASGGYVNFTLLTKELLKEAVKETKGFPVRGEGDRIMVEYLSPNTNKPLHLGHVRNGVLGSSLSNVLADVGHTVIPAILINDRGVHICKSMLACERFMGGQTPESSGKKPDHFVGDCYVRYGKELENDPSLDEAVSDMLKRWEAGDKDTHTLWKTMNDWVYQGFDETLNRFGFSFEKWYYESKTYLLGKDLVLKGLERGVFERQENGAIVFPLDPDVFGLEKGGREKIATVLREDGTSLYLTQDIGTAEVKADEYHIDRSVYVVACEQDHHFKVLFEILKKLGYPWAEHCHHLSYEMVNLPEGRMKSREGTSVDADTLADQMTKLAELELLSKRPSSATLDGAERLRRANVIALAAIKFYLLRYKPRRQVKFDTNQSLSFVGDTGPYCLYAYARASSILGKLDSETLSEPSMLISFAERDLLLKILGLNPSIQRSADEYDTSILAEQVLAIAKSFNNFYTNCPVLPESDRAIKSVRVQILTAATHALQRGLNLLGIEVLEEM